MELAKSKYWRKQMNIYSFLITSLIIILIPGTGVIFTLSIGITKGKNASILAALGCTIGIIPHLCASVVLSSLLAKMSNEAFVILKLMGALYLLYLGFGMILSKTKLEFSNIQMAAKPTAIIRHSILINLLNPKLTLFFFSFLPQYISSNSKHYSIEYLLYGFAFMLLTFVVFVGYGVLAGSAKTLFISSPKRLSLIQKIFGFLFVVFAIQLTLSSL
jgi:threonine/homoserine/homoserine lactone efflux protein